jgi:hypothetical protein
MSDNQTVSDTDVLKAVGAAYGVDLTGEPRNDVQAVIHAFQGHGLSQWEALVCLLKIVTVQKGLNEGDAADWAKAGMLIGPDLVKSLVKLAALLA